MAWESYPFCLVMADLTLFEVALGYFRPVTWPAYGHHAASGWSLGGLYCAPGQARRGRFGRPGKGAVHRWQRTSVRGIEGVLLPEAGAKILPLLAPPKKNNHRQSVAVTNFVLSPPLTVTLVMAPLIPSQEELDRRKVLLSKKEPSVPV